MFDIGRTYFYFTWVNDSNISKIKWRLLLQPISLTHLHYVLQFLIFSFLPFLKKNLFQYLPVITLQHPVTDFIYKIWFHCNRIGLRLDFVLFAKKFLGEKNWSLTWLHLKKSDCILFIFSSSEKGLSRSTEAIKLLNWSLLWYKLSVMTIWQIWWCWLGQF